MDRIAQGDASAFRTLSQDHLQAIVTFVYRLLHNHAEAEDVAQETFLRAWTNAAKYQPQARVSTWLHAIARNLAIDHLRKRKTRGESLEIDDERDAAPLSGRPSQLLVRKQQALTVQEALLNLPERQRSAILLSHEQGHSNIEIAEILKISVEAVESLLSRGRRQLRVLLSDESDQVKDTRMSE